jgi:phage head maturation protease
MRKRLAAVTKACVITLSLAAIVSCSGFLDPRERLWKDRQQIARSTEEAATAHVSVLSVARWDEYKKQLQPSFAVSESDALGKVLADTARMQEGLLSGLSFGINANLEARTRAEQTVDGVTTVREYEGPLGGAANAVDASGNSTPIGAVPSSGVSTLAGTAVAPELPAQLPINPMLQYQAAAALFQEVRLINQTVENAAERLGYSPYLVRLQLSVMPNGRRRPYDALVNLSFFSAAAPPTEKTCEQPVQMKEQSIDYRLLARSEGRSAPYGPACLPERPQPVVVPLLVTDDLEGMLRSQQLQNLRQVALGLSLLKNNIGARADARALQDSISRSFGRDFNALITVASVSQNTFRVRLGAMQDGDGGASMVPRTYNMSLLLLVPCPTLSQPIPAIDVISSLDLTSIVAGTRLDSDSSTILRLKEEVARLGALKNSSIQLTDLGARHLVSDLLEADMEGVRTALGGETIVTADELPWVYAYLVQIVSSSPRRSTRFELPIRRPPEFKAGDNGRLALYRNEQGYEATIMPGYSLALANLYAGLEFGGIAVPADAVRVTDDWTVKLAWRNIKVSDLKNKELSPSKVVVTCRNCVDVKFETPTETLLFDRRCGKPLKDLSANWIVDGFIEKAKAKEDPKSYSINVAAREVFVDSGRIGQLSFSFRYAKDAEKKPPVYYALEGADMQAPNCTVSPCTTAALLSVAQDATVTVGFRNAADRIVIRAGTDATKLETVDTLIVRQIPPAKE